MSDKKKRRSFTREFKLSVLARMQQAESIVGLAQELKLERKLLYCWRDKYAAGGSENLRRAGRPSAAGSAECEPPGEPAAHTVPDAQQRIAELERKIGQQQLEVDFFRAALQQVRGRRRSVRAAENSECCRSMACEASLHRCPACWANPPSSIVAPSSAPPPGTAGRDAPRGFAGAGRAPSARVAWTARQPPTASPLPPRPIPGAAARDPPPGQHARPGRHAPGAKTA